MVGLLCASKVAKDLALVQLASLTTATNSIDRICFALQVSTEVLLASAFACSRAWHFYYLLPCTKVLAGLLSCTVANWQEDRMPLVCGFQ
jgi:hypothetical protein